MGQPREPETKIIYSTRERILHTGWQKYSATQIMLTSKWELHVVYKVSTCLALRHRSHIQVNKICVIEYFWLCHPADMRVRWLFEGYQFGMPVSSIFWTVRSVSSFGMCMRQVSQKCFRIQKTKRTNKWEDCIVRLPWFQIWISIRSC